MERKEKGILVVSFGTTYAETRKKNIGKIIETVRAEFPECEIREAYSSGKVRNMIKARERIEIPGVGEALDQMKTEGLLDITVFPTHIIPGIENLKIKQEAMKYRNSFRVFRIAGALLEEEDDYGRAAKALWDSLRERADGRILILMGHGTAHEADVCYERLERELQEYSGENIYIATVEGKVSIGDVIAKMQHQSRRKVLIAPLMLVAGDHAVNDMQGSEHSFQNQVSRAGFEAECLLKGIGEYKKIRDIYIGHLKKTNGSVHQHTV